MAQLFDLEFLKILKQKLKTGNLRSIHLNALPGRLATRLDLEREAFVSLCGEKLSQDRMKFMLKKGKPLRN